MKQTIDEAMKVLNSYHNGFSGYASNIQDSIDVAIDIMHKYQKIKQALDSWSMSCINDREFINTVREVVDDEETDD